MTPTVNIALYRIALEAPAFSSGVASTTSA